MDGALEVATRWLEAGPPAVGHAGAGFLLLTPLGVADPTVARTFLEAGVSPLVRRALPDYPRASLPLYAWPPTVRRVQRGLDYEAAWRALGVGSRGEVWVLTPRDFLLAWQLKPGLRVRWPARRQGELLFRSFHLPDPDDVARQWAWMDALAELSPPGCQAISPDARGQ